MIAGRVWRIALAVVAVLALAIVVFLAYAHTVMAGERPAALEAWRDDDVTIRQTERSFVIEPAGGASGVGLVFIPGAKVDPAAYLWKLSGIVAESGATVVITEPTLNLAFFDFRPLSDFTDLAPEVDDWFVGGHSLGGVRACQLAEGTDGLVLFGSYCANDLSESGLAALSISASQDGLSTPEKIDESAHLLPADTIFVVIEGGNHAGFGAYGAQAGDGEATIPDADIRAQITGALGPFLQGE